MDDLDSEIVGTYRLFGNEDTSTFTTRQKYKKDGSKHVIEYDGDRWKIYRYDGNTNTGTLLANQESVLSEVTTEVCLSDTMHIEWVVKDNAKAKLRCKGKQPQIKS